MEHGDVGQARACANSRAVGARLARGWPVIPLPAVLEKPWAEIEAHAALAQHMASLRALSDYAEGRSTPLEADALRPLLNGWNKVARIVGWWSQENAEILSAR